MNKEGNKSDWRYSEPTHQWFLDERYCITEGDYNKQMNLQMAYTLMTMIREAPKYNSGVMIKDGTVWHNMN